MARARPANSSKPATINESKRPATPMDIDEPEHRTLKDVPSSDHPMDTPGGGPSKAISPGGSSMSWPSRSPSPVPDPFSYIRRSAPEGIYHQLQDRLFSKQSFAGHPGFLKGVRPVFEPNGNCTFTKDGGTFRILIFGEMATILDGVRLSASGNKHPPDAPVSTR